MNSDTSRPKFSINLQQDSTKNKMHGAIRDKDLSLVKKLVDLYDVLAQEECSVAGYYWNCLHYGSHFHSDRVLEFFLKRSYKLDPDNYLSIVNERTKEGWTPLMISAIYGSTKCLNMLLQCGGMSLNAKDNNGRTAGDLAKYYGKTELETTLTEAKAKLPTSNSDAITFTPIAENFLSYFQEETPGGIVDPDMVVRSVKLGETTIEERDEYSALLMFGDRLPCLICLMNRGLIKYTSCCGQPLHPLCKTDKLKNCPNCNRVAWNLTSEVEYPERAFMLRDN